MTFSVISKNGFVYIADESGKKVASLLGTEEQKFANAHLFAAAGDMREALKAALATIENTLRARGYSDGECTDKWSGEVRIEVATRAKLRAAIAKAEGKQQSAEKAKRERDEFMRKPLCASCEGNLTYTERKALREERQAA